MLGPALQRLLTIASTAEVDDVPSSDTPHSLRELLVDRNGFVAFYSALHVRRSGADIPGARSLGAQAWSGLDVWRTAYPQAAGLFIFGEDVFANQFALDREQRVHRLDVESGELTVFGASLEEWAERILGDHRVETGWPVAQEWQDANGILLLGQRLVPRQPFVLGGEYEIGNLRVMSEQEAVRRYAILAQAIANAPDGASVTIHGF